MGRSLLAALSALMACGLLTADVLAVSKKKARLCNDYLSPTKIGGKSRYYVREPEDGRIVTRHEGMDFCAKAGTEVIAAGGGLITDITWDNPHRGGSVTVRTKIKRKRMSNGNEFTDIVYIRHLHIDPLPTLKTGQDVRAGDVIGKIQKAGKVEIGSVAHVHFSAGTCFLPVRCHVNPNDFWADGPGKLSCFDETAPPPPDKLVVPLRCR